MSDDLLRARRSVRRFRAEVPPAALVEELVAAAVTAPSAGNQQPWRFLAVRGRPRLDALGAAVTRAVDEVAPHVAPSWRAEFRTYAAYFSRFAAAPLVLVVLYRPSRLLSNLVDDALPASLRARVTTMEETSGLVSAACAIENLLLAATARGLGSCVMTGPLLAGETLRALLPLPASLRVASFVALGYPDEEPAAPARRDVAKVLRWID